ncbi:integral membrane sensor domain MASE1 [Paenarthrobacter nitroguajacolicus]|uniref:hypothetical protein n=1 Tax=Paenarthrobacter nitroguajacolicus TaxID=211146 RepID=UPI002860D144|nr:hypothetical protein [Paenarthrobacter nitroguajacolicus]MDR6986011.1 integral membrane sensor domain MASE1 [Paenarthrobacter nitroguajacolicus]
MPQPTIFVVAAALVGCILAAVVRYRKWRWVPSRGQESGMARISLGCVTATTLALLLRGYPLSFVLTPLIGIAAIVGMNRELTTRGRLIGRSKG